MRYKSKSVEIIGRQRLFDKETLWIRVLKAKINFGQNSENNGQNLKLQNN